MATIYKLNEQIQQILGNVDEETGEIPNYEELEQLRMDKHEKLRNIGFFVINREDDVRAFDEQIKILQLRKKHAQADVKWGKGVLSDNLQGKPMKEPEFTATFRKSTAVEVDDGFKNKRFLVDQEPKLDKVALKKALKDGEIINGARLVERQNIIVK